MAGQRWKRQERAVAAVLGTERNPSNGRRQTDMDVELPGGRFGVEHKTRKRIPQVISLAMEQAEAGLKPGQTPLVVISHCPGRGHSTNHYVVLRLADFQALAALGRLLGRANRVLRTRP